MPKRPTESEADMAACVAENIRRFRALKGLTQAALGTRVGLDPTVIAKMETRRRNISADELWRISKALEVEVGALYDYPGADEDGLFLSLVAGPVRELEAQLSALVTYISASGEGTLNEAVRRVRSGLDSYQELVPEPHRRSADSSLVDRTLITAKRFVAGQDDLVGGMQAALEKVTSGTPIGSGVSARVSHRANARRAVERGVADR